LTQAVPLGYGIDTVRRRQSRLAGWKGIGSYGTIGLEMVLSVMFGMFGGRWLDGKFDTAPYLMLIGFGFGVATAVRALVRALGEMRRETAGDGFRESTTDRPARFALEQRGDELGGADEMLGLEAEEDSSAPGSERRGDRDERPTR
jgi:F0F1-type ATP synthase assembly protein I